MSNPKSVWVHHWEKQQTDTHTHEVIPIEHYDRLRDVLDNLLITHYRTMSQGPFKELWNEAKTALVES